MIHFQAEIKKFGDMGEKTGWTFVEIPAAIGQELFPGNKRSFRVKGLIDQHPVKQIAIMPIGGGDFIFVLNGEMRKHVRKTKGQLLTLQLELDTSPIELSPDLVECLAEEPKASGHFYKMPKSHQNYFSKWIESAKTIDTKTKRILMTLRAMERGLDYGQMLREDKKRRDELRIS